MTELRSLLAVELRRPAPAAAVAVAEAIRSRHGSTVAAILFYGSARRTGDTDGVLDFYVLVDDLTRFFGNALLAGATRLLPPTIALTEVPFASGSVRAKIAILTPGQFAAGMPPEGWDTTLWARFAQPVSLVYARDAAAAETVLDAIAVATTSAAYWAVLLGPATAAPLTYWQTLFSHTYAAELRVERADRSGVLISTDSHRYETLLVPALAAAGMGVQRLDGAIEPRLDDADRARARAAWGRRQRVGKLLNVARLVKAAFTTKGGPEYLAWKIERHSGVPLELTSWQKRHPILSAPAILWRLVRRGTVR
jgi:hypothetical protein